MLNDNIQTIKIMHRCITGKVSKIQQHKRNFHEHAQKTIVMIYTPISSEKLNQMCRVTENVIVRSEKYLYMDTASSNQQQNKCHLTKYNYNI